MAAADISPAEVSDPALQTIRAQYLAGRIDAGIALAALEASNMRFHRPWSLALLARPMSPERVFHFAGVEVTEEQITARLAEVPA